MGMKTIILQSTAMSNSIGYRLDDSKQIITGTVIVLPFLLNWGLPARLVIIVFIL